MFNRFSLKLTSTFPGCATPASRSTHNQLRKHESSVFLKTQLCPTRETECKATLCHVFESAIIDGRSAVLGLICGTGGHMRHCIYIPMTHAI